MQAFGDRPEAGSHAVLVGVNLNDPGYRDQLAEFQLLASGAGLVVDQVVEGRRDRPDPALFVGRGKADEIAAALAVTGAGLVLFNRDLSPVQERNLERHLQCRVLDRTRLILEIFSRRARSAEGKLQVDLAQLRHQSTRLVRGWTHLERQKGGIGVRGGPGETQLEIDRRLISERIRRLEGRLSKLERSRGLQRRARQRRQALTVSLVGYTNAGKSSLFNALTCADAYTADQLFATLDTTSRRLWLPEAGNVILSDTVGFMTGLPHTLVAAFHATLEEAVHADLLLHVVDSASPTRERQMAAVDEVLAEIGAAAVPQIVVMNKIDLTEAAPGVVRDEYGKIVRVFLSAKMGNQSGAGLEGLRLALAEFSRDCGHSLAATQTEMEDDHNGLE